MKAVSPGAPYLSPLTSRTTLGIKVIALFLLLLTGCMRWDGWAWLELIHLSAFLVGVIAPLLYIRHFFKAQRRCVSLFLGAWSAICLLILIFAVYVTHHMGWVGLTYYFYPGPYIYRTVALASLIMLEIIGYITGSRPLKD